MTLVFQNGVNAPAVMLAPLTGPRGDNTNANLDPHLLGLEPTVEPEVTGLGSSQVTKDKIFFPNRKMSAPPVFPPQSPLPRRHWCRNPWSSP